MVPKTKDSNNTLINFGPASYCCLNMPDTKKKALKQHHSIQRLMLITDRVNKTLEALSRGIYNNIYLILLRYIE